jgi:hypothetical protein
MATQADKMLLDLVSTLVIGLMTIRGLKSPRQYPNAVTEDGIAYLRVKLLPLDFDDTSRLLLARGSQSRWLTLSRPPVNKRAMYWMMGGLR